jgi:hypothetical protein
MGETKWDNGRLLQPSDVNSSQEHQLNPGALFPRVLEAPFVTPTPSPGGAIQVSGGLRHFYLRRRLPDTGGKEKAMFARALECQSKGWQRCANQERSDEQYAR